MCNDGIGSSGNLILENFLHSRWNQARHLLVLDGALGKPTADILMIQRESGTFDGIALATIESHPKQPRFRVLRLQVTVMYHLLLWVSDLARF